MIKCFEKNLIECLNLWRGNINQVQYSCVSQWHIIQQLYTSSIICVHMFKKVSKFNHNQYKFENFQKFHSPVQVNWVWKKFKKNSKSTSSKTWVKKFQSFKVQMPGCEMSENSENILSPNQRWLNKEIGWKTNGWKNQKINLKFRLAEIFSNFSWMFTIQH